MIFCSIYVLSSLLAFEPTTTSNAKDEKTWKNTNSMLFMYVIRLVVLSKFLYASTYIYSFSYFLCGFSAFYFLYFSSVFYVLLYQQYQWKNIFFSYGKIISGFFYLLTFHFICVFTVFSASVSCNHFAKHILRLPQLSQHLYSIIINFCALIFLLRAEPPVKIVPDAYENFTFYFFYNIFHIWFKGFLQKKKSAKHSVLLLYLSKLKSF